MTFVIGASCVADYSCVEACPVDCIHPTPDEVGFMVSEQLYINPATCINCAACADACPVDAIHNEQSLPERERHLAAVNAEYYMVEEDPRV
jgi:formate hydrogenlyase subunit 6/NADH:ubiquinone oxidoreductase subunit I